VGQNCQHKLMTFSVLLILFVEVTLHYIGSKKLNVKKDKNITLLIFKLRNRAIVLCYSAFYHIIAKIDQLMDRRMFETSLNLPWDKIVNTSW